LRKVLESFQLAVAIAHNGEIAINLIKEKTKSVCFKAFQLVFMDCDMPLNEGFEKKIELRALQEASELPSFPIIAATAFFNEGEVNQCFE
jgi:CheY-like chemotaxis protein